MKNFLKNLINNRDLRIIIALTSISILAILIVTFTSFEQIPFIYNEF